MQSRELDKSISDVEEKELIAKKLKFPESLLLTAGKKFFIFMTREL